MEKERELKIVALMIGLYCKKKHGGRGGTLCPECTELFEYVKSRREKCPWGDGKPFCSNCRVHCYKKEMRERISAVMRFSGPRMALYHPVIAFRHLAETKKQKNTLEKETKMKA